MVAEALVLLLALGVTGGSLRPMARRGDALPFLIFFGAYGALFYLGALGMHCDARGFFEQWVASIGIQELDLSRSQHWQHFLAINCPFLFLPVGYALARAGVTPIMKGWAAQPSRERMKAVRWGLLLLVITYPLGTFFRYLALAALLILFLGAFPRTAERPDGGKRPALVLQGLFWCSWGLAAAVMVSAGAFGSFYTFLTQFNAQAELMGRRTALNVALPFLFWILAFTVLPCLCAAAMRALKGRRAWIRTTLMILATLWVVFVSYFKGLVWFFLFFLVFVWYVDQPRRMLKPLAALGALAIGLLGSFYMATWWMTGSSLDGLKLLQHFLYRLGVNQFFYTAYFPGVHPWLPLDINPRPLNDSALVYGFIYPGDASNPAGTTAGPYICNAWAQGGLAVVAGYSVVVGFVLQVCWTLARSLGGPAGQMFRGRVLFLAFMAAQLSFRDLLFGGFGLLWSLLATAMIFLALALLDRRKAVPI